MARKLRWVPPGSLVSISTRVMQGLHLLRPSQDTNELFLGSVGRAIEATGIKLHAISVLSTHCNKSPSWFIAVQFGSSSVGSIGLVHPFWFSFL